MMLTTSQTNKMNKSYKNPILAAYLNIVFPGLGCVYLHKWGHAILFLIWTPLRLWLGVLLFNSFEITTLSADWNRAIHLLITYIWWAIVMWDTCFTPYHLAKAHNDAIDKQIALEVAPVVQDN